MDLFKFSRYTHSFETVRTRLCRQNKIFVVLFSKLQKQNKVGLVSGKPVHFMPQIGRPHPFLTGSHLKATSKHKGSLPTLLMLHFNRCIISCCDANRLCNANVTQSLQIAVEKFLSPAGMKMRLRGGGRNLNLGGAKN